MPDLRLNTSQIGGVTIAEALLSDKSSELRGRFQDHHGTAHFIKEESGAALQSQTVDDLLEQYPAFASAHVLKVDTDGFDPAILRGSKKLLSSQRPVVFYEWDPYSYGIAGESDFGH